MPYWKEGNASRWTRIQVIVLIIIVVILHFLSLPFLNVMARRGEDVTNVKCVFWIYWASRTMAQRAPTVCRNSAGSASFRVGWKLNQCSRSEDDDAGRGAVCVVFQAGADDGAG